MPAAAVIRRGQALSGFTGCKGSVDGAASLSTEKFGAQTGMPTAEEVETALKILNGESVEKEIPVEMELITK